jgi:hypothetical protein
MRTAFANSLRWLLFAITAPVIADTIYRPP